MTLIGIDFSCNKPAMAILKNNELSFAIWPLAMDQTSIDKMKAAGVYVNNRERLKEGSTSSEKFRWHIQMSGVLTTQIVNYIANLPDDDIYFAFEGSSFGSKGDAALQLAGYRYVLVNKLASLYGINRIFTYAPMTVKSIAGCASKDKKGKNSMIEAFSHISNHVLAITLRENPMLLKKKTNFIDGVDDLADAYWVLETLRVKEEI